MARFGFERVAYRGLETGHRNMTTHVVRHGSILFAFSSPLSDASTPELGSDMNAHIAKHGDGVKDVAFSVDDCRGIYAAAMARGAESIREPTEEEDADGKVILATVKTYGDTVHTFVEHKDYRGPFLPNYRAVTEEDPFATVTPPVGLELIDHVVGNMPDAGMEPAVGWYERVLQFHRFWSADDSQIHTEYSALRSIVVADYDEKIKMPINEPAPGLRKSQIQEYVEYYAGAGVQHIALSTKNIINAIDCLRRRGVKFLRVPDTYYTLLRERMAASGFTIKEDLDTLQRLNILVDFDERGYLLQLFTNNLMDRPTVFLEIIQREGNTGFGAGNFKSLFESIEREQAERGNLTALGAAAGGGGGGGAGASAAPKPVGCGPSSEFDA